MNKKKISNNSLGIQVENGNVSLLINIPQLVIQNHSELSQNGNQSIKEAISDFINQLCDYYKTNGCLNLVSQINKPHNIYALSEAANAIGRNNLPEKRILLFQLLKEKLRSDKDDDSDDEYTQAIKAMNNISLKKIKLLSFIEIATIVLAYHFKRSKLPNIEPIISFIKQLNEITEEELNYLIQAGLIYNLYPKEIDSKKLTDIPKNPQDELLMDTVNSIREKHKDINLNLYSLSKSGHQIAKAYINNYLGIDYLDNYSLPTKYTIIIGDNVVAMGAATMHAG